RWAEVVRRAWLPPAAVRVAEPASLTSRLLESLLAADERWQALVLLATRGAAVEVGSQSRDCGVGVGARELELVVFVELCEALVATDLRRRRSQKTAERLLQIGSSAHVSSSPTHASSASPASSRCLRSLRRASCNVL